MVDPTLFTPALQYGALGLLFVVILLGASAGGWLLKKFVDQVIRQADKMTEVADAAVASGVETVIILKLIGQQITNHDERAEQGIRDAMLKLTEIRERIK